MALLRRWLLILSAFLLVGASALAAGTRESRAFAAAVAAFQDGNWSRAETAFTNFVQRFPASTNVPSAVLLAAQAQFQQGKYAVASAWLTPRLTNVGVLADAYTYWLGEAQFAQGDFTNAAATLVALTKNFPDSPLRLTAMVEAAAAYAQFPDWSRHDALLEDPNGIFARAAARDADNALVINGRLSLAQSKVAQNDFADAKKILDLLNVKMLAPEQDWQRQNLLFQVELGLNNLDAALAATTNLLAAARTPAQVATSVALQATALEKKKLSSAAVAAWSQNLTNGAPVERQREAVLKIAALAVAQDNGTNATDSLQKYLAQFPNSPVAELVLMTLGELHLKDFLATASPDQLAAAQTNFDQFIGAFTNSPLTGKACLDRGWCNWNAQQYTNSLLDFRAASQRLPVSTDLAVAKFKTGDALFMLKDFAGARENYFAVLDGFDNFPEVAKSLDDRALYQIVRADLQLGDLPGAEAAVQRLLQDFPASDFADNGLLLAGEAFSDFGQPEKARAVFEDFAKKFPDSPLAPEAELAVARTFERSQDWPAAITNYEGWLKNHPTNALLPQVQYALGRANYQSGRETNALQIFGMFVTQFPTNELAPSAQWWLADSFFRAGNYVGAETNYELIFQTLAWKNSGLFFPAQLMAGRAAAGRLGFSDANAYFVKLLDSASGCPDDIKTQVRFAYAASLMQTPSADTNNALMNFQLATNVLGQLPPTNRLGVLALSEIADCNFQLGALDAATNDYAQVMASPYASAGLRSRAQVGLGRVLEKKAEGAAPDARKALLDQACNYYLNVVDSSYGKGLDDDESADAFWVKKAGLLALPLLSADNCPTNFFARMEILLPPLKDALEKKKASLKN